MLLETPKGAPNLSRLFFARTLETRIIQATNTKPTRVVVIALGGSRGVYSYGTSKEDHIRAAVEFALSLKWDVGYGQVITVNTRDGYVHAFPFRGEEVHHA